MESIVIDTKETIPRWEQEKVLGSSSFIDVAVIKYLGRKKQSQERVCLASSGLKSILSGKPQQEL